MSVNGSWREGEIFLVGMEKDGDKMSEIILRNDL